MGNATDAFEFGTDSFDSRDIIERIDYLEGDDDLPEEEQEELDKLIEFRNNVEAANPEWYDGMTFIREDDFENYAREYAEEIGAIDNEARWPAQHIDWKAAADSLRMDYAEFTLDGTAYLAR